MSNTTANTVQKSNTATGATNAISSKKMTSSGSKAAGGGDGQQANKPSAWSRSSVNPVTGRASGSPVQNGVKSNGASAPAVRLPPNMAANEAKPNDRLSFLFANMKGLNATLLLKNGERYSGIFSSVDGGRYTIKMAKKLPSQGRQANGVSDEIAGQGQDRTLSFNINEVVDLSTPDVRFDKSLSRGQNGASSNFRTDTDISSGWAARERNLQKWEGDSANDVDLSLGNGHTGDWDQFATHKKMTGIDSTYDENHYTTRLNKSQPGFDAKAREADRIAREIEGSSATNAHVAEERGQKHLDDSGLDEEAKYSGVQRGEYKPLASGGANKYQPPAMRPPTGQASVSGAPVDPAIISSAFAKPKAGDAGAAKKEEAAANTEAPKPAVAKENAAAPAPASKTADKPAAPALTVKPTVPAPIPAARPANKEGGATATVEKDVHEAFREFNKAEKLRVQEHQRSVARRDKAVKLNDLKKFAQNFKLTTEVPADLLPILARDEKKQLEISEKAKKNAEDKSTPPRSTATSVAATPSDAKTKPATASRQESGPASPLATAHEKRTEQQRTRQSSQNMGGSVRGPPPQMQGNHRQPGNLGQRLAMNTNMNRGAMPQHAPGPIPNHQFNQVTSPGGAMRFDPSKTFVPTAMAKPFVPAPSNASSSSSPVRAPSSQPFEVQQPKPGNLFEGRTEGRKSRIPDHELVSIDEKFNPIPTLREENLASLPEDKREKAPNDGLPPPHKTFPTWSSLVPEANREKSVKDMFDQKIKPAVSPQAPGPHQFQNQLPGYGPQGNFPQQQGFTPNQTPRHNIVQPHHGPGTPHHFEAQAMQFSQSTSAVQPSPRPMQPYMHTPGGPQPQFYQQPMGVYGTSPGGSYMMARQQSQGGPQFPGAQVQMMPGQPMYMAPGGQVMYQAGQPQLAFFPPGHMAGPQPGVNGYPSPANRPVMMQGHPMQSQGNSGGNTPQFMTPYMAAAGPAGMPAQMRYAAGPQVHHQQFAGQPQHFGHPAQQQMRGPSGNFQQPQMMQGGPQQMMAQAPPPPLQQQAQDAGAGGGNE